MANLNRSRKRRYVRHYLREGNNYSRANLDAAMAKVPSKGHPAPKSSAGVATYRGQVDFIVEHKGKLFFGDLK